MNGATACAPTRTIARDGTSVLPLLLLQCSPQLEEMERFGKQVIELI